VCMCALTLVFAPICYSVLRFTPAIEAEAPHKPSCSQSHPAVFGPSTTHIDFPNQQGKARHFQALSFLNAEARYISALVRPNSPQRQRIYTHISADR
jgi:hypothetical protein